MLSISILPRALRLEFVSCSILPFIFGTLLATGPLNANIMLLGMLIVATTHLSANLINDYSDSRSGADWHDTAFYKFFGGSKLIQEGILSEKLYLITALISASVSLFLSIICAIFLSLPFLIPLHIAILIISWMYTMKPLSLAYNYFGEVTIFLLFGIVPVFIGFFLQNPAAPLPVWHLLLAATPIGLMITAILIVNEIPDYLTDLKSNKMTIIHLLTPSKAYFAIIALYSVSAVAILLSIGFGLMGNIALLTIPFLTLLIVRAPVLSNNPKDKAQFINYSKLAIISFTLCTIVLCISA